MPSILIRYGSGRPTWLCRSCRVLVVQPGTERCVQCTERAERRLPEMVEMMQRVMAPRRSATEVRGAATVQPD